MKLSLFFIISLMMSTWANKCKVTNLLSSAHLQHKLTVLTSATLLKVLLTLGPFTVLWQNKNYFNFQLSPSSLLSFPLIRWWVCWTRAVCHISPKATTPSPLWRAASSPLPAWPPAAASAWITSRAWRVSPAFPPCRLCHPYPAPSPTAPPPTAHRATPLTTWRPTSTASTDKVRSIDSAFLFSPFTSTPRPAQQTYHMWWIILNTFTHLLKNNNKKKTKHKNRKHQQQKERKHWVQEES